MGPKRN